MSSGLFKMLPINYLFTNHIRLIYMYKLDLALDDLQRLICDKTQPTYFMEHTSRHYTKCGWCLPNSLFLYKSTSADCLVKNVLFLETFEELKDDSTLNNS